MQAQARICPTCIDDHASDRACKPQDLIDRIDALVSVKAALIRRAEKAETENASLRAELATRASMIADCGDEIRQLRAERDEKNELIARLCSRIESWRAAIECNALDADAADAVTVGDVIVKEMESALVRAKAESEKEPAQ